MNQRELEKKIIEHYQNDERAMILIFSQWCVNNGLNAKELYQKAYPQQFENPALKDMMEKTVPKEESEKISDDVLIQVLQLFGNEDLAFVIQEEIEKRDRV